MGGRDYYDENNGYTYTWNVGHDYAGLIQMMGGAQKAEGQSRQPVSRTARQDKYEFQGKFPDSTAMVGSVLDGNEPSFAIPYIYNRLGAPWKTQARIRMLLNAFFTDTLQGIPGDEDGGGMSAFCRSFDDGFLSGNSDDSDLRHCQSCIHQDNHSFE